LFFNFCVKLISIIIEIKEGSKVLPDTAADKNISRGRKRSILTLNILMNMALEIIKE